MLIRPATEADIPAIMDIERTEGFDAYVGRSERAQHEALMASAECRYIMLEDETGPVGFAILQGAGTANGIVYLKRIAIRSPGKGSWQVVPLRADPAVLRGLWSGEVLAGCLRDQ